MHPPGEDKYGYERPEERWLPVHTVETILLSVISMLSDPNDQSPANIDAAVCKLAIIHLNIVLNHMVRNNGEITETCSRKRLSCV